MNKTRVSRAPKKASETTAATEDPAQSSPEVPRKAATVIALLREPSGGTLKAIMAATGWQSHSVRGFISAQLVKKRKLKVKSFKRNGERVYKILR
jgi:Protein of unknown function (DUF3489)